MSKKHDERKCLKSLSRVCRIEGNFIVANFGTVIGIHRWGMIDYLIKCHGYRFHWSVKGGTPRNLSFADDDTDASVRAAKKARKEHKLINKKK